MPEYDRLIRLADSEAADMVQKLSEMDVRSMGGEVAWLIRQEYARRFSQPNPCITIEQAVAEASK